MENLNIEIRRGIKFILVLGLFSVLTYALLHILIVPIESITAFGSAVILNLMGISAHSSGSVVVFNDQRAVIVELCTGILELSILIGAVIASEDRTIRQRTIGMLYSIVGTYIVNILRIGISLASAIWYGWKFAEIIHNVAFKFFLIIIVLGMYSVWYLEAGKRTQ